MLKLECITTLVGTQQTIRNHQTWRKDEAFRGRSEDAQGRKWKIDEWGQRSHEEAYLSKDRIKKEANESFQGYLSCSAIIQERSVFLQAIHQITTFICFYHSQKITLRRNRASEAVTTSLQHHPNSQNPNKLSIMSMFSASFRPQVKTNEPTFHSPHHSLTPQRRNLLSQIRNGSIPAYQLRTGISWSLWRNILVEIEGIARIYWDDQGGITRAVGVLGSERHC